MTPPDALAALAAIGRTTLALAVVAIVVEVVLRLTRPQSPRVHRAAWICVLAVGWLFFRVPVAIPYYESVAPAAAVPARWDAVSRPHPVADRRAPEAALEEPENSRRVGQAERGPTIVRTRVELHGGPALRLAHPTVVSPPSWPAIALGLWITGMIALIVAWLAGYAWFVWRLPAAIDGPAEWREQWDGLLAEHGIRRPISLHVTTRSGPMLCRLPRGYRLLVPVALWNRLEPAGRLSVLRHELEHFRRGDVWKSLLARLAALPHWFNPAAWWAVARLDEAAEWACDAAACGACPTAAADYAKSLLALDELAARHALLRPAAWGRGLSQRIRRLTAAQPVEDTIMKRIIVVGAALCLVAALGVRFELVAKSDAVAEDAPTVAAVSEKAPTAAVPPPLTNAQSPEAAVSRLLEAVRAGDDAACREMFTELAQQSIKQLDLAVAPPGSATARYEIVRVVDVENDRARVRSKWIDRDQSGSEKTDEQTWLLRKEPRGWRIAGMEASVFQGEPPLSLDFENAAEAIERMTKLQERTRARESSTPHAVGKLVAQARPPATRKPSAPGVPMSAEPPAVSPSSRANLRYDGKSFDEWHNEAKTELKTERRTEAILAFAEFGRRGYGKEATQAILEVLREYPYTAYDSPEGKLREAARKAFGSRDVRGRQGGSIPSEEAVPILIRELKSGNENSRNFALDVLAEIGPDAKAAIPALLEIWESSSDWKAIRAIMNADSSGEHLVPLVRKAFAAQDVARVKQLLNFVAPFSPGSRTNALVEIDPASAETINATADLARMAGANVRSQEPKLRLTALGRALLPVLVEAVGHKTPEIRQAAIMALGRCEAAGKSTLPDLTRAFEKGNAQDRIAVAAALAAWAPDAFGAAPALIRGLERTSDFWEKAAIARTLGKMGAAAKDALPLIEKAISDLQDAYRNRSLPPNQYQALQSQFNDAGQSIGREVPGGWSDPRMRRSRGATASQPAGPQPLSTPKPVAKEPKPAKAEAPKGK